MADDLRTRIVEALRGAPVHATVMRLNVLTDVYGPVDSLVDAVLALVQSELDQQRALNDETWGSVWLHGNWREITRRMGAEEREHAADAVARWSRQLIQAKSPDIEPEGLRWWREPAAPPSGLRGLLEHVRIDVAGRVIAVDGIPIDDVGSAPTPEPPCGYCGCTTPATECTTCNHDEETPR